MKRVLFDAEKCLACHTCENACAAVHSKSGDFVGAAVAGEKPLSAIKIVLNSKNKKLRLSCLHCDDPECVNVCPVAAMKKDPDTGVVWCCFDECIGCFACVSACPYDVITPIEEEGVPFKCDMCRSREGGPACVESCPTEALTLGVSDAQEHKLRETEVLDYLKEVK